MASQEITIYHSPDADDAFMFYGLTSGAIGEPGFTFTHELCDIESLNKRALKKELECTAVSVHAYAYLADDYVILKSGASMGEKDYGPKLVVKKGASQTLAGKRIGIPGIYTSATLALKLYLHSVGECATLEPMHFDQVQDAVKSGEIDAGLIIHEGQLTHEQMGLQSILDLGQWWWSKKSLPLPLGVNVVRKDIGPKAIAATAKVLKGSIEYSLAHRKEAIAYALSYGRGLSEKDADTFVGMYVNDRTVNLGEEGERSIREFLRWGAEIGAIPKMPQVVFA